MYAWWQTTGGLFPDSIAYLMQARELVDHGHVYLLGYGHVDSGLILPPMYPLLVGAGTALHGDGVLVSQWLSGVCLLLATIPLFLWVERATNLWCATAATSLVQWQPMYFLYGTSTLTEGLFTLAFCALGYAASVLPGRERAPLSYLLAGMGAGALFLIRQLGLFMLPVLVAVPLLRQRLLGSAAAEPRPWLHAASIV